MQKRSQEGILDMQKRILQLRLNHQEHLKTFDMSDNMPVLQNAIDLIIQKNMSFYAQRQLQACYRSYAAEKEQAEMPPGTVNKRLRSLVQGDRAELPMSTRDDIGFYKVRRELRNTLDKYLQESYALLKYQNASAQSKLIHFFNADVTGPRLAFNTFGSKRMLMQKKFKLLGQLEVLNSIYSELVEYEWDITLLMSDNFYSRIYPLLGKIYNSGVDQKFLINIMNLKNQKKESKKFITFLEGAKKQAYAICFNEQLNYDGEMIGMPQLYHNLIEMIEYKLEVVKQESHPRILEQYHNMKITLTNFQINLGKLKAYFNLFCMNDVKGDLYQKGLDQKIKKLTDKLEQVDIEIVNNMQNHMTK